MTTSAAVYCRISSDPEGREHGVQRQEADCRALAERLGYDVADVFTDNDAGASTRSTKPRPKYADMLRRARNGEFGAILAYSNSRLTRRPREVEDLLELAERHNIKIRTCVSGDWDLSTADGRAVARTIAAWDAAEAERTAERVSRAKVQAAQEGRWRGGPRPFGYKADGVTVEPDEARELRDAARAVLSGRSLNAVARDMAARGVVGTRGRVIDGIGLRRILRRPRNAGLMEVSGEIIGPGDWPAIIEPDLWRSVQALLNDPRRRTTPGPERKWLGSGLYRCGICGNTMYVTGSNGRRMYRCRTAPHVTRYQPVVDEEVCTTIRAMLWADRDDLRTRLLQRSTLPDNGDDARIESLNVRLRVFESDYRSGDITGRQLREATESVRAELDDIERRRASRIKGNVLGEVLEALDPGAAFDALPLDRRRAIVAELVTVTIPKARRGRPAGWSPGRPYADPSTIQIERVEAEE